MHTEDALVERFVMGIDIENYGDRSTRHQKLLQERLHSMLDAAAREAGLDRARWDTEPGGDGELAALPPGTDLARVVGPFVRVLDDRLRLHNEDHSTALRLRLRLAMHCDVLIPSAFGTAGPAFVEVARLLAAQPLRETLQRNAQACLVLLVSPEVYRKVVRSDLAEVREPDFEDVRVVHPTKQYDKPAHLYVPRHRTPFTRATDDHGAATGNPPAAVPAPPAGSPSVVWHGGDGNKDIALGNQVSGNLHVGDLHIQEAPKADPLAEGMAALRDHDYAEAADRLRQAVVKTAGPATTRHEAADLRFRLALALLRGRRPRLHRRADIHRIERELEKVLTSDPDHVGALLLGAIVKQDYYRENGFDFTGPAPEQMVATALRVPFGQGPYEAATEIIEHVPAWENPIWSLIHERIRSGPEESA